MRYSNEFSMIKNIKTLESLNLWKSVLFNWKVVWYPHSFNTGFLLINNHLIAHLLFSKEILYTKHPNYSVCHAIMKVMFFCRQMKEYYLVERLYIIESVKIRYKYCVKIYYKYTRYFSISNKNAKCGRITLICKYKIE